jgi:hypothetical protein
LANSVTVAIDAPLSNLNAQSPNTARSDLYSPAEVVAVSKEVVSGDADQYISTSFVERQNLSLRMGQRRFTRLTNGFSKKLDNHVAAVALYVAHYNLCRAHEALKMTPAKAIGVADRVWAIGDLIDAALATQPITPVPSAPERRKGYCNATVVMRPCNSLGDIRRWPRLSLFRTESR